MDWNLVIHFWMYRNTKSSKNLIPTKKTPPPQKMEVAKEKKAWKKTRSRFLCVRTERSVLALKTNSYAPWLQILSACQLPLATIWSDCGPPGSTLVLSQLATGCRHQAMNYTLSIPWECTNIKICLVSGVIHFYYYFTVTTTLLNTFLFHMFLIILFSQA